MKINKKILCLALPLLLMGCTERAKVSDNIRIEADNFNVVRRVLVINTITDKIEFECVGRISVSSANRAGELEIIVETGENEYKKHMVKLTELNMYVVEDLEGSEVDKYKYYVNYQPESIVPFDVTNVD